MAKKSTNKNSSMNAAYDLLAIIFGGAIFGFLALTHVTGMLLGAEIGVASGYDLISFEEGANTGVSIMMLLLLIFAGLMVLSAILKLLVDLKVVKGSTFEKVVTWMMVISAAAVAVIVVVSMIVIPTNFTAEADKITNKVSGNVVNWLPLILNAVFGIGSLMVSVLAAKKN